MISSRSFAKLLFALATVTSVLGQDQPFTIRVNVAVVTLDAVVQEENGRVVTDLAETEFEIFEDGQPQEIVYFASSETPRSVLLLFDVSGSTDSQRPFMVQSFNAFLALLRPTDRVALASFAGDFQMLMNWREVEGKPQDVRIPAPQFSSNVYSSVQRALESIKGEKGRRGVIVMTDGQDSSILGGSIPARQIAAVDADKNFQKIVQNVKKFGVPLYFIALNTDRNSAVTANPGVPGVPNFLAAYRERMERLAEVTGGRILYPRTLQDVAPLYQAIGRELGLSYSFGYAPKSRVSDGKPRRIEVRVRREGMRVTQSRDSYLPQ